MFQKKLNSEAELRQALSKEADNLRTQLTQLNAELDQSQGSNGEMAAELESLRETCAHLNMTNKNLQEAAAARDTESTQEIEIGNLRIENSNLTSKLDELTTEVQTLKLDLSNGENSSEALVIAQQVNEDLKSELEMVKSENVTMREKVLSADKERYGIEDNMNQQLSSLAFENDQLKQALTEKEQLESDCRELIEARNLEKDKVQSLTQELAEIKGNLESSSLAQQNLLEDKAKLSATVDELRSQIQQLEEMKTEMNEQLDLGEDAESKLQNLEMELQKVKSNLEKVFLEKQQLHEEKLRADAVNAHLQESLQELDGIKERAESAKQELETIQTELSCVREEKQQLIENKDELSASLERVTNELHLSQETQSKVKEKLEIAIEDKCKLNAELEDMRIASEHLLTERQQLLEMKSELEETINRQVEMARQDGEHLKEALSELDDAKTQLLNTTKQSDLLEEVEVQVASLTQQVERFETELDDARDENQALMKDKNGLSASLELVTNELEQLKETQSQANEELDLVVASNNKLQMDLEEAINEKEQLSSERLQLLEFKSDLERKLSCKVDQAQQEKLCLDEALNELADVKVKLEDANRRSDLLENVQLQVTNLTNQLERVTGENEELHADKLKHLQEMSGSEAVKEELQILASENQSYKKQLTDYNQLQVDAERYQTELHELADKLQVVSKEYETFQKAHSDYDDMKLQLEGVSNDLAIVSIKSAQMEDALSNAKLALEQSEHSNQSLRTELDSKQQSLNDVNSRLTEMSDALENLKHSNQAALNELQVTHNSAIGELQTKMFTLQQERDSLIESSQAEQARQQLELKSLEDRLEKAQLNSMSQANDLTHSYEEEKMLLNFRIKDLEAKLEDSRSVAHEDVQDEASWPLVLLQLYFCSFLVSFRSGNDYL